ncbi:uncharacterized protein BDW47DRAFT_114274 [Aspergillus candidus]|uniref:Uncharacterized protein n=1 Tax=Aspergillus candidus TaxID=41067 RepID=A0A2I2EY33_ASPCN|nr:hypothetical protein BDW47DRAFT_114274 [Aspergillus candidus]PLB33279.1 hypothetical protein BDW47DRAFT_114274 [Aspergillus candidus]
MYHPDFTTIKHRLHSIAIHTKAYMYSCHVSSKIMLNERNISRFILISVVLTFLYRISRAADDLIGQ